MNRQLYYNLKKRLDSSSMTHLDPDGGSVLASVMIILRQTDSCEMLFIKRPDNPADAFSGHIAFPGGKKKPSDRGLLDTAIRETYEEVGIDIRESALVAGKLDDTRPGNREAEFMIVTPYISVLTREVAVIPNNMEVDRHIWIPVMHLMDERNMRIRKKFRGGIEVNDYVYSYKDHIIWGMTGRIVRRLTVRLGDILAGST